MIITIKLLVLISLRNMPNNFENFNKFLKPDYKPTFNGFRLDRRNVLSVKAGMLNLVHYLPCIQGDHHEIEPVSFIQTDGFNQANFTRMSQHIDYYFVPYTCIKSQFHEWFQQTTDPVNSVFAYHTVDSSDFLPYVNLARLIIALAYACSLDHAQAIDLMINDLQGGTTLESFCGINYLSHLSTVDNPLKYKDLFVDSSGSSEKLKVDRFGYPVYLNAIRLLDQARYGNYLPVIKLPNFTGNKKVLKEETPAYLEYIAQDFELQFLPSVDVDVNILALAAYQAVCHNYYVNTYYERPDTFAYNFDDVIGHGDITLSNMTVNRSQGNTELFTMNYRPWKKDIFLSALPSPQFGDVSVVTVLSDLLQRTDTNSNVVAGQLLSKATGHFGNSSTTYAMVGSFSVIDQVKAEALQYWRQQVGRAGYRTADRFRATFGHAPGFDPQIMPVPIGSVYSQINKDTVVGTSGDEFGDKRATGTSLLQNEHIEFDCPSFGVIIGLLSILPEADYDAFGIDKHHTYFEPFDFPTPQLQNLGLVPLNIRQLTVYSDAYYQGNGYDAGFVPEYSEDKQAFDLLHGEFSSMPSSFMRNLKVSPMGAFSSYVSSRIDMESFVGTTRQFYVDPAVLDNLFLVAADAEQNTDPFKIVYYATIKSHRPLHVLGLPQF